MYILILTDTETGREEPILDGTTFNIRTYKTLEDVKKTAIMKTVTQFDAISYSIWEEVTNGCNVGTNAIYIVSVVKTLANPESFVRTNNYMDIRRFSSLTEAEEFAKSLNVKTKLYYRIDFNSVSDATIKTRKRMVSVVKHLKYDLFDKF